MPEKYIKHKIISSIFSQIPFSLLEKSAGGNLLVPYYHMVSDQELLHIKHLYQYKNIMQFENDLEFLLKNFSPVNLRDVMDSIKKENALPQNSILLTFDDGFREMHDVVAPILFKKGVSGTFFVNSDFIDNVKLCYQHKVSILAEHLQGISLVSIKKIGEVLNVKRVKSEDIKIRLLSIRYEEKEIIDQIAQALDIDFEDYLLKNRPYLSTEQIWGLIREGFYIGAHSIDHPLYSSISLEDQLHQTKESIRYIRERFCLDFGAFAFPHNDNEVSRRLFTEIYSNGLVDVSFGTAGMMEDVFPNHIHRFSLEKPLMPARNIIALQIARKYYRGLKGQGKIERE
jgi:peptidoglycan/xylan/chitin deacetylase (PgdA/CDA1 family)